MSTTIYPNNATALLVVDPYNDFMSEGGKLFEVTNRRQILSVSTRTCGN